MAFSDETNHCYRWFNCSWGARAETADSIAHRLQAMARDIRAAEPELTPLWPYFTDRAIRVTDPGPADEMDVEDLGRLIDRRARFDPPQLPAPVGPWGYSLTLGGPPSKDKARRLGVSLYAGSIKCEYSNNNVCVLELELEAGVWRSPERGLAILRALVRAWEPRTAGAWARLPRFDDEEGDSSYSKRVRPWIRWKRDGSDASTYQLVDVGTPALTLREMGGEFRLWS